MCGAGGNSTYRTLAFKAVCTLTPHLGFSVHLQRCSMPHSMRDLCEQKEKVWARNGWPNFARQSDFHLIAGFFNVPQSCDMGQMALLPLQRKACWGFCRPKNDGFGRVWTLWTWVPSMLTTRPPKQLVWIYCHYSRASISAESVSAVSLIRSLLHPEKEHWRVE
jgi:hypothetical protein